MSVVSSYGGVTTIDSIFINDGDFVGVLAYNVEVSYVFIGPCQILWCPVDKECSFF